MSKVIATIKLAPGKVAFYDECSHIHLTIANPIAYIYEDTPLKRIKSSIRSGTLRVINGNLNEKTANKTFVNPEITVAHSSKEILTNNVNEPSDITSADDSVKPDFEEIAIVAENPAEQPSTEVIIPEEPVAEKTTKKGRKKSAEATVTESATETSE